MLSELSGWREDGEGIWGLGVGHEQQGGEEWGGMLGGCWGDARGVDLCGEWGDESWNEVVRGGLYEMMLSGGGRIVRVLRITSKWTRNAFC